MTGSGKPKKKRAGKRGKGGDRNAALLLLSVSFLLGAVIGMALGQRIPGAAFGARFWQAAGEGFPLPPLWLEIWSVCRWPAAVLLLRALPMGGGTVPALFVLRGGLLSYCVSALAGRAGLREILGTGVVLAPVCLFAVPVFFLLGIESLMRAAGDGRGAKRPLDGAAVCVALLAMAVLSGRTAVPALLSLLYSG